MRVKVWLVATSVLFSFQIQLPALAAGLSITAKSPITSSIDRVGDIWKGDIPIRVTIPSDSISEKIEFPITGILPYSVLADKALGVDVEFQIWSDSGVKLASTTVYSFNWNPVGPNTMVSMYLSARDNWYGTHTMIITTTYETSTTGLLSRYLKDEKRLKFTVEKVLPNKSPDAPTIKSSSDGNVVTVEFDPVIANPPVAKYQLTVASLTSPKLPPTSSFSFGQRVIIMEGINSKFVVTKEELKLYFNSQYASLDTPYILLRVEAVNSIGTSDTSNGIYYEPRNFGLSNFASAKNWSATGQINTGDVDSFQACQEINYDVDVLLTQAEQYNQKIVNFKRQYGKGLRKFVFYDALYPLEVVTCSDDIRDSDNRARNLVLENAQEELRILEQQYEEISSSYKTITCIKGKTAKKVSGRSPKCPAGFRKK